MALTFDGTSPNKITFNGTTLKVIKYDGVYVYAQPNALSISQGSNTTVTVTRTSSPYQGASIGVLSNGSVVYYGDVLKITASADEGYELETFTVNDSNFTSGDTITVTKWTIVTTTATESSSWYTVFTGSSSASRSSTTASTVALSPTITIPSGATKIRVSGSYTSRGSTTSFTNKEITLTSSVTTYTFNSYVKLYIPKGGTLGANLKAYSIFPSSIKITKLEACDE